MRTWKRFGFALVCLLGCRGEELASSPGVGPDGKTDNPGPNGDQAGALCDPSGATGHLEHDDVRQPGAYEIDTQDITFVDPTRETPENDWYWGSDERKLKTTIYYPAGDRGWFDPIWEPRPVAEGGPFPLIVYAHGYSSSASEAKELASHLASYGYIVVAPTFPLTNMLAPGGPSFRDVINQPGDVSFVIDQMLAKSLLADDRFFATLDPTRIGIVGLSLGGMTTSLSAFHPDLGDPRIRAAVTLAGPADIFGPAFYAHRPDLPLLVVHGDTDAFIDYETNARPAYERASPNANLLTLISGSHAGFASIAPDFLMEIIGEIAAPEGANPDNPDALGCGFVAGQIAEDAGGLDIEFLTALGDESIGILPPSSTALPCENDFITRPALEPGVQVDITKRAVLAFFAAYFDIDDDGRALYCDYLNEVLPTDPDVVWE